MTIDLLRVDENQFLECVFVTFGRPRLKSYSSVHSYIIGTVVAIIASSPSSPVKFYGRCRGIGTYSACWPM